MSMPLGAHFDAFWMWLKGRFEGVAKELATKNSQLRWSMGRSDSKFFPFRAYASFSKKGIAGEEDIVISIDFKSNDSSLKMSCDIARGDGEVLVDGPCLDINLAKKQKAIEDMFENAQISIQAFLRQSVTLLEDELGEDRS